MINKITYAYDFGEGSAIGFIIISILFVFAFFICGLWRERNWNYEADGLLRDE